MSLSTASHDYCRLYSQGSRKPLLVHFRQPKAEPPESDRAFGGETVSLIVVVIAFCYRLGCEMDPALAPSLFLFGEGPEQTRAAY